MSQRASRLLAALLLALGLIVTACGGPASSGTLAQTTPTPQAAPSVTLMPGTGSGTMPASSESAIPEVGSGPAPAASATPVSLAPQMPPATIPAAVATRASSAPTLPRASANATAAPATGCTNVAVFVADGSIPDNTAVGPGQGFVKTWQLRNRGSCTWGTGYALAFVSGQALTATTTVAVPSTDPGTTADVSVAMTAPTTAGTYRGYWQLKDNTGRAFGPQVWALIKVAGPAAAPSVAPAAGSGGIACTNVATFVTDVTLADNSQPAPGQAVDKTWRLHNRGSCTWSAGYAFAFVSGEAMTTSTSVTVPDTAPGATVDVSVPLIMPASAGTHQGFWQLRDPNGKPFGPTVWVLLRSSAPAAAPTLAPVASGSTAMNCTNAATFVSDVSLPDNTLVAPGQTFAKGWRLRNRGTCAWGAGYTLAAVAEPSMAANFSVPVPATAPGASADVSVTMTAPQNNGAIQQFWQLQAPDGTRFGPQVWVLVNVNGAAAPVTLAP